MIEGYRIFDLSLLGGNLGAETTTTTADDQPLGGLMLVSDVLGSIRQMATCLPPTKPPFARPSWAARPLTLSPSSDQARN